MGRSYTEEEKRQIVAGFFVSGLTQEEYARQRGVSVSTFRHWLSELYSKSDLDPFVLSPKLSVCPATARAGRCGDAQISRYLREGVETATLGFSSVSITTRTPAFLQVLTAVETESRSGAENAANPTKV